MARILKRGRDKRGSSRSKSFLPTYEMQISEVSFEVLRDRTNGQMVLTYSLLDRERDKRSGEIEIRLPIVALWASPQSGEVIKAHLTVHRERIDTILFYNDLRLKAKQASVNRESMTMIASSQVVMRYGRPPGRQWNEYDEGTGDYTNRTFYDSKALAIEAILHEIRHHRNVGGVSIASFSHVPDELLLQVGFLRIDEILGRSVPMWAGDPAIFRDEQRGYGRDHEKKLTELIDIFLTGLQESLR